MLQKLAKYNKLWVALIGAIVTFVGQYYGVNNEVYRVAVPLLTALGVYAVPNKK